MRSSVPTTAQLTLWGVRVADEIEHLGRDVELRPGPVQELKDGLALVADERVDVDQRLHVGDHEAAMVGFGIFFPRDGSR
jgi:hypothetical protein